MGHFSSIQVLQYGTAWHPDRLSESTSAELFPQAHVNIVLNCLSDHSGVEKCFTIRGEVFNPSTLTESTTLIRKCPVNHDTTFSITQRPRYVTIDDAVCFQEMMNAGSHHTSPSNPVECSKITLEFSDSAGLLKSPIKA